MFFTGSPICVGIYTNNFHNFSCWMGRHPPCDAPMESPDSALFEGIGSSVPRLYHRKELSTKVVLIFQWFLSSGFYSRDLYTTPAYHTTRYPAFRSTPLRFFLFCQQTGCFREILPPLFFVRFSSGAMLQRDNSIAAA